MLENHFPEGFGILESNSNSLKKIPNLVKQRIHAEEKHNLDYVMTCITNISSIPNILKKLFFHSSLNSSYIKTEYNDKEEIINITFITHVEPLSNDINHPALIKEWKLNLEAVVYEKKIDADVYKPSSKKEIDHHDSNSYWPTSIKDTIQWFTFSPLYSILKIPFIKING